MPSRSARSRRPQPGGAKDETPKKGKNAPVWAHSFAEPSLYTLADTDVITERSGVDVHLCPLSKSPDPVMVPEGIYEGEGQPGQPETYQIQDGFHFGSVLYDAELARFQYWYNPQARLTDVFAANPGSPLPPDGSLAAAVAYATSEDGLTWDRPALGLVHHPHAGSRNLSIMARPPARTARCPAVVRLPEQFAPDRFAAAYYSNCADPLYERGILLALSEDGIYWKPRFPPAISWDGDRKTFSWDSLRSEFLLVSRSNEHRNLARRSGRPNKRHIAISRSRDLQHWTPMTTVLEVDQQDPADLEFYSMYVVPYGHGYIGLLEVFHTTSNALETQLAFSRDLVTWQRIGDRAAFLAPGADGEWDSTHICLTMNEPHLEAGGTQLRFWYGGKSAPHWQPGYGALGTATLRRDGFVAATAGADGGTLTTLPFRVRHHAVLYVNAQAEGGEIRVEVVGESGQSVPGASVEECSAFHGDAVRGNAALCPHREHHPKRRHCPSALSFAKRHAVCLPLGRG